ncbi:hypothetical protein ACWCQP_47595 [Streptomyces chartreusis]
MSRRSRQASHSGPKCGPRHRRSCRTPSKGRQTPQQRSRLRPTRRPWLYRHYPASSHPLRGDRIVDEVQAVGGDARMICELFGLSIQAATRYTATGNFPSV